MREIRDNLVRVLWTNGSRGGRAALVCLAILWAAYLEQILRSGSYPWFFRENLFPRIAILTYVLPGMLITEGIRTDGTFPYTAYFLLLMLSVFAAMTAGRRKTVLMWLALGMSWPIFVKDHLRYFQTHFPPLVLVALGLATVVATALICFWRHINLRRWAGRLAIVIWRFFLGISIFYITSTWLGWAMFRPLYATLAMTFGLTGYAVLVDRNVIRSDPARWAAAVFVMAWGGMGIVLHIGYERLAATPAEQTRVFPRTAYDIGFGTDPPAVALHATRSRGGKAWSWDANDRSWDEIPNTKQPQRITFDPVDGTQYIINWGRSHAGNVASINAGQVHVYDYPLCRNAVGIALDWKGRQFITVCESSSNFFWHRIGKDKPVEQAGMNALTHTIAVDVERRRLYVGSQLLKPLLYVFDLDSRKLLQTRRMATMCLGLIVDPKTGHLWATNATSGEVLEFDTELRLLGRQRVGVGPRDIAYDEQRGAVITGEYFGQTVSAVETATRKRLTTVAAGDFHLSLPFLRGTAVDPCGNWYAAMAYGIWQIRPPLAPASRQRKVGDFICDWHETPREQIKDNPDN